MLLILIMSFKRNTIRGGNLLQSDHLTLKLIKLLDLLHLDLLGAHLLILKFGKFLIQIGQSTSLIVYLLHSLRLVVLLC